MRRKKKTYQVRPTGLVKETLATSIIETYDSLVQLLNMPHIFAHEPAEYFVSLMFLSQKKYEKQKKSFSSPSCYKILSVLEIRSFILLHQ